MRIAALCDIHGNLPALEAVLEEVRRANVDRIIVAGDVLPGPMPRETLARLLELEPRAEFLYGNGDLAVLAQMQATDPDAVTYSGTASGAPLPKAHLDLVRWTAQQLDPEHESLLASWPKTIRVEVPGLREVLFCHATPRNETEIFTRLTAEERLLPVFGGLSASVVVCGHTHMQFDRTIGRVRVVNAGSVGMPFQDPGAYWLLLGPDVQLRRTSYDLTTAAERITRTSYPQAKEFAEGNVLRPPSEAATLESFSRFELTP